MLVNNNTKMHTCKNSIVGPSLVSVYIHFTISVDPWVDWGYAPYFLKLGDAPCCVSLYSGGKH